MQPGWGGAETSRLLDGVSRTPGADRGHPPQKKNKNNRPKHRQAAEAAQTEARIAKQVAQELQQGAIDTHNRWVDRIEDIDKATQAQVERAWREVRKVEQREEKLQQELQRMKEEVEKLMARR